MTTEPLLRGLPAQTLFSATTTISIHKLGIALTRGYAKALSRFSFVGLFMASSNRSRISSRRAHLLAVKGFDVEVYYLAPAWDFGL
ncbi:MAG: hypothetical protein QW731_08990, partial [Thermofilaceae archaeon]